jgi:CubicO group peptidase (beta-lactamase class C family)
LLISAGILIAGCGTTPASLRDMERYLTHYLRSGMDPEGNRLVNAASLEEIFSPRLAGYALGWGVIEQKGVRYLQHAGSNTTFTRQILMVPSQGFAVVVMCNRGDPKVWRSVGELVRYLARLYGY